MLTDTRQALLDAIRDNPDDDAPRLIYADWLEEQGDTERAKFIRLQIEEATMPEWSPRAEKLRRESERLFKKQRKHWLVGLPRDAKTAFRRGFLSELAMTGWQFLESIEAIWRIEPVSKILFRGPSQAFREAVQSPLASGLRGLGVSGVFDEIDAMQALAESPHLSAVQDLSLHLTPVRAYPSDTLAALQEWRLPELRRCYCSCLIYAQPVHSQPLQEALLRSLLFSHLEECTLLRMVGREAANLFGSAPTDKLRFLWVSGDAEEAWHAALLRSPRLKKLRQLSMTSHRVAANIQLEFIHSELLSQLKQLSLHLSQWSPNSLIELIRSPQVRQLETLTLAGNIPWTPEVTEALMMHHELTNLRYFRLQTHVDSTVEKERLQSVLPTDCIVA